MADFGPIIGDALSSYALIGGSNRSLGTIMPHVAIEEVHHDTAVLTQHPVSTGSPITDHMFLMPKMVEIRWGWSDSTAMAEGYCIDVYNELLSLQQKRKPFPISTAWRQYRNMQIVSLTAKNDAENPNALLPIAVCQEIIMADIQTTGGAASPSDGSGMVANVNSGDITKANATAAGLNLDTSGNVSWPNQPTTMGTQSLTLPAGVSSTTAWGATVTPFDTSIVGHH